MRTLAVADVVVSWRSWGWDHLTVGWVAWMLWFAVWETYALVWHPGQELTAHLRPVFLTHSLLWFLAFGAWLWIGVHLLAPALEQWILDALG